MAVSAKLSKFSVLVDQGADSSDEENSAGDGFTVVNAKRPAANKAPKKPSAVSPSKQATASSVIPGASFLPTPAVTEVQNGAKKKKRKPTKSNSSEQKGSEQFDEWSKYDAEAVEGQYEEELKQAILQSKLEASQQKLQLQEEDQHLKTALDLSIAQGGSTNVSKKITAAKPVTVSLDEFNRGAVVIPARKGERKMSGVSDSGDGGLPTDVVDASASAVSGKTLAELMEECEQEAKTIMEEEKKKRHRDQEVQNIDKVLINVYKAKLEDSLIANKKLEDEVSELQEKLEKSKQDKIKLRQQKEVLCQMISRDAETKEMAKTLLDLKQTKTLNEELTEEVAGLRIEVEKCRSKAHELENELKKHQHTASEDGHYHHQTHRSHKKSERD